jgi:hypothetical protein
MVSPDSLEIGMVSPDSHMMSPELREEAVQGAGMVGPLLAQGAAESGASAHL